ncbi:toll/interleukin-1 receptor domain-containing protein [Streptomyces sp. NPDC093984]|uniref:toll/interleukin-1 receptor domain-containing protein n=1 Tax=Streptomyces sp. NPDC093984 TaxID=3366052 RepID=UPI003811B160
MQIFISWSGDMAKQCAEALRDWLPYMNQAISPFVSSQDISKGERGLAKIADQLQECSFGIVCVTRANQSAPWINFESGALSRELGESSLIPFLIDMQVKDLSSGPLTQFQATDGSSQDDVWAMVKAINAKCETSVEPERLRTTFDRFWEDLEAQLISIREAHPTADAPQRAVPEILDELVKLVRDQHTRIGALERTVGNVGTTHYTINEPREVRIGGQSDDPLKNLPPKERALRVGRMAREMIGPPYVEKIIRKGAMIELHCHDEGVIRARKVNGELESMAINYSIPIDIFGPGGELVTAYPGF